MLNLEKILKTNKIKLNIFAIEIYNDLKNPNKKLSQQFKFHIDFTIEELEKIQSVLKEKYKLNYTIEDLVTIVED